MGAPLDGEAPLVAFQEAHRRLSLLYDISKLLIHVANVDETVRGVLALLAQAVPCRSAVVILGAAGRPQPIGWIPASAEAIPAEARALASFDYFVGDPGGGARNEPAPEGDGTGHALVLPLVIDRRAIFGILRVEAPYQPGEQDLAFVNIVANQLAIALEWRANVEARQSTAEAATSAAQRGQQEAETLQAHYQALATENDRLLKKAENASRLRDNFLAVVSHDLRNLVDAILMSVTLLLRRPPSANQDRRAARNVTTIQRAARGMSRMIDDLLDVASIEAGQLSLQLQPEDARILLESATQTLEEPAAAKSVRLHCELVGPDFVLVCDRQRIDQVLSNLIGNALKFTPEGGAITVRAEARGQAAHFAVSDTGVGISREDLPHVFEQFWHGSNPARSGSGLGLAIAKGIVEAHGGRIGVESQAGVGTTVDFTLPLSPAIDG